LVGLYAYPNTRRWQELRRKLFGPKPKNIDQPRAWDT
jgi:hypothetical protein